MSKKTRVVIPEIELPNLMTAAEVAKVLRLEPCTIYKMCRRGELETIWVTPRSPRVTAEALRRFLYPEPTE